MPAVLTTGPCSCYWQLAVCSLARCGGRNHRQYIAPIANMQRKDSQDEMSERVGGKDGQWGCSYRGVRRPLTLCQQDVISSLQ